MADSFRPQTPWPALALALFLPPSTPAAGSTQEPAARPAPDAPAPDEPGGFALPGEDAPRPFVPREPLTVDDRRRIDVLRHYAAARALERQRRWSDAISELEKALEIDPEALPALRRLSRLAFVLGQTDRAIKASREALAADPSDAATLKTLVEYYVLRRDEPAAAEALLREVLDNPKLEADSPGRLLALAELGRLYAGKLRQLDKAADAFADLVDRLDRKAAQALTPADKLRIFDGDEAGAYALFGQVFTIAGRPQEAVKAFQRGLVYAPDHPLIPLLLAQAQLDADRPEEALAALDPFLRRQPPGREPYDLLVQILVDLKREDEILPRLEEAAERDPRNVSLQYALADRYGAEGKVEKANDLYKTLLAAQPDLRGFAPLFASHLKDRKTDDLLKLMERTYGQLGRLEPLKPQIDQLLAEPEYADEVLARGLEMFRADPPELGREGWAILTRIANDGEKLERLLALQDAFREKYPNPQIDRERTDTLIRLKRYGEAADSLERLMRENPEEKGPRLLVFLARLRAMDGKLDEAAAAAREARDLDPNESEALGLLITILGQSGKFDEALGLARDALKAEPGNPVLVERLGLLLNTAGKADEAIDHFKGVLERFPNNDELVKIARLRLSSLYISRDDYRRGEAELETLLEQFPDDPLINNDLGYIYADQGKNLERAEGMIRKALEAEPDNAAYLDSLGWVLYKLGRVEEAVEPLEKAIKLLEYPDATLHDHLGDVYFRMKDWARAKESWAEAEKVASDPASNDAKRLPEIRKKLESLEKLGDAPKAGSGDNP